MITKYVANTYEITDSYKEIVLNAKDAKVKIEPSDDNSTKLFLFEKKSHTYGFFIKGDTLTIKQTKTRWYDFLRIGIEHSEIKLCIPESILEKLSVKGNVGNVDICSITCKGNMDIWVNTGDINLENITCKTFNSKVNSGKVLLDKFIAKESIFIKGNTGKVELNDCSAPDIFVKNNTGKVCGKLPPDVVFTVQTNTGKIEIPKTSIGGIVGGRCEIKTNTGNVKFE